MTPLAYSQLTVVIQPDSTTSSDAVILTNYPTANFYYYLDFHAGRWTHGSIPSVERALIKFDLTSIPSDAEVVSSTLTLYANVDRPYGNPFHTNRGGAIGNTGWLQKITADWDNKTVTWNNQPSTTTSGQIILYPSLNQNTDYSLDVSDLVKDMVNKPDSNFGFLLRLQDEVTLYNFLSFHSSESVNSDKRPSLEVVYVPKTYPITIYQLITKTKDNKNDFFYIDNIEKYPSNEVVIYNQWGNEVFKKAGYNNDWDGGALPEASYYYVIKLNNENNEVFNGQIYIDR